MKQTIILQRRPTEEELNSFWANVTKTPTCWTFKGPIKPNGYGCHYFDGREWNAHRFSFVATNLASPLPHLFVCHRCDNPPCVRPTHLYLATPTQNMADMRQKHRGNRATAWATRTRNEYLKRNRRDCSATGSPFDAYSPEEIVASECERLEDIFDFKETA